VTGNDGSLNVRLVDENAPEKLYKRRVRLGPGRADAAEAAVDVMMGWRRITRGQFLMRARRGGASLDGCLYQMIMSNQIFC
jgi:hypothetical protein